MILFGRKSVNWQSSRLVDGAQPQKSVVSQPNLEVQFQYVPVNKWIYIYIYHILCMYIYMHCMTIVIGVICQLVDTTYDSYVWGLPCHHGCHKGNLSTAQSDWDAARLRHQLIHLAPPFLRPDTESPRWPQGLWYIYDTHIYSIL